MKIKKKYKRFILILNESDELEYIQDFENDDTIDGIYLEDLLNQLATDNKILQDGNKHLQFLVENIPFDIKLELLGKMLDSEDYFNKE